MDATSPLPTGTVTFLLTDIEDGGAALWPRSGQRRGPGPGTRRWDLHPEAMQIPLARHHALLTEGVLIPPLERRPMAQAQERPSPPYR